MASNFRSAIVDALEMRKNNEKAITLYTIPKDAMIDILSICFESNIVLEIGKSLTKLIKYTHA